MLSSAVSAPPWNFSPSATNQLPENINLRIAVEHDLPRRLGPQRDRQRRGAIARELDALIRPGPVGHRQDVAR